MSDILYLISVAYFTNASKISFMRDQCSVLSLDGFHHEGSHVWVIAKSLLEKEAVNPHLPRPLQNKKSARANLKCSEVIERNIDEIGNVWAVTSVAVGVSR